MKGWSEGHPRVFTVSNLVSNQPLICCSLGGILVQALIDTGSMKSFITRQIYEQLRPKQEVQPTAQRCYGITGQPLPVHGTVQTTLSFPNNPIVSYPGDFLVSDHLLEPLQCIIGWDFLQMNCSFHFTRIVTIFYMVPMVKPLFCLLTQLIFLTTLFRGETLKKPACWYSPPPKAPFPLPCQRTYAFLVVQKY